jgi:hypothetical protein
LIVCGHGSLLSDDLHQTIIRDARLPIPLFVVFLSSLSSFLRLSLQRKWLHIRLMAYESSIHRSFPVIIQLRLFLWTTGRKSSLQGLQLTSIHRMRHVLAKFSGQNLGATSYHVAAAAERVKLFSSHSLCQAESLSIWHS